MLSFTYYYGCLNRLTEMICIIYIYAKINGIQFFFYIYSLRKNLSLFCEDRFIFLRAFDLNQPNSLSPLNFMCDFASHFLAHIILFTRSRYVRFTTGTSFGNILRVIAKIGTLVTSSVSSNAHTNADER